jgi:hypothetical protein
MLDLNYLAVAVAAVAAVMLSTVYYTVFAQQLAVLSAAYANAARPPVWKVLVELARSFVVASVLAGLASLLDIVDWSGAVKLALAMWVGFPVMLLSGLCHVGEGALEARRHPRGRLAREASRPLPHGHPLAVRPCVRR